MSDPVLIRGPYDLWMRGERTPDGIQMSIENYRSLREGRDHLAALQETPLIEIAGVTISMRDAALLVASRNGAATLAEGASAVKTSIGAARRSVRVMADIGLATMGEVGEPVGATPYGLTERGVELADILTGEGL